MVLTSIRELAMPMRISVAKYFGSGVYFVFYEDNIIVDCSINVNITIAINYFVNTNLYFLNLWLS